MGIFKNPKKILRRRRRFPRGGAAHGSLSSQRATEPGSPITPNQPPRTDSWRFSPGEASGSERPAICPWRSHRSHRGQIADVSLRVKRVAASAPRLACGATTKKPPVCTGGFLCWRKPIFPGRLQPSIFGAGELNFRVRDGNGWTLAAINTNYSVRCLTGQLQYNTTAF